MVFRAVIFDIGGVIVPQQQIGIRSYGQSLNLPPAFLENVFMNGVPDNAFCKLERGELHFTEFAQKFNQEVLDAAKRESLELHNFDVETLFDRMSSTGSVRELVINAITQLSRNGFKTCGLTNNWVDDRKDYNKRTSKFMVGLWRFFDTVIQSSRVGIRKPDLEIYKLACERLGVKPSETIFLDDIGLNLKEASALGITCIKVSDPKQAMEALGKLTNLNLNSNVLPDRIFPPPCKPGNVPHAQVVLRSNIKIHYVDVGEGPVVMLFHGFPESWYSWRHQIPALANAGYRVIAMDQRGYGDSSVPYEIQEYTQEKLCQDAIDLMDVIGIAKATIVGHDWGGAVVWNLALFYPHRINGVCGVNTPIFTGIGLKKLQEQSSTFNYHMYFQAPGVAEREFEDDIERAVKIMFRGVEDLPLAYPDGKRILRDSTNVTERGGFLVGYEKNIPRGKLITEEDVAYYTQQFRKSGFRGPLNWYRNSKENMEWQNKKTNSKILLPALMVTSSHDVYLKPEFSLGMEDRIPNLSRLDIRNCTHWTMMEKPAELNEGLIKWLDTIHHLNSKI